MNTASEQSDQGYERKKDQGSVLPSASDRVNINLILQEVYRSYRNIAIDKGLEFRYDFTLDEKDSEIVTNVSLFSIVISSLIGNALVLTESGYISFGYMKKGGTLEFYVSDTGRGYGEDKPERIYDGGQNSIGPAVRGGNTIAGLDDCKVLVRLLGGSMCVKSDPWEGTLCQFTIPYLKSTS